MSSTAEGGGGGLRRSRKTEGAACAAGGCRNKGNLLSARSVRFAAGPFRLERFVFDPPSPPSAGQDAPKTPPNRVDPALSIYLWLGRLPPVS